MSSCPGRPEHRRVFSEWGFAEAVIDGDRIWLSGVVAGLRPGQTMADAEAAYDRSFKMLGDVLARSGSSFDGVVEMTTFHTDLPAQMSGFMKVKHHYIREPFPAWTAIDIDRLVPDGGLVEIKLVARRKPDAR
jgi:enamine deaminase RidA (YjgF/YER057c/UK114 family)